MQIEPVVTLASLVDHPDAEMMGINELVQNNYDQDMETRYVIMSAVDQGDSIEEVEELTVTGVELVSQGMWCGGRLYDEGTIAAFTVKGREGLWAFDKLVPEE